MKVILAIAVYLIMAAILIAGVLLAVKGSFWLLIIGMLGFILGLTKIALLHH